MKANDNWVGEGLQKFWMLNRDPERFESPKLGNEVRTVKMSRWKGE